jgi:hypothetical protein
VAEVSEDQRQAVRDAVEELELTSTSAWGDLDVLSTHTSVEDVEVEDEGVVITGDTFTGVANVYVTLQYGKNDDEGFSESESFLGSFQGHFEQGVPVIDNCTVDTRSFYGRDAEH